MKKTILTGLLAGLLIAVLGSLLNFVFGWFFPSFQDIYRDTDIFISMNEGRGLLFFVYPFALGLGLVWLYGMLKNDFKKPFMFASIYFVISAIPAFFINAGSFNLPVMMILTWTIISYLNGLVTGFLFQKMLSNSSQK